MRGVARVSLLALALLLSSAAAEAAGGKRVGVPKFEGAQEALVRKDVMKVLKSHGFEVVGSRAISGALKSPGAGLDSDDGLKTLAKELSLSAIVTGEVGPKRAKIVVHDGGEGSILGDASFSGANPRKLGTEVALTFWKKLGPDVGRGHVPSGAKKPSAAAAEDETAAGEGEGEGEAAAKPKDDSSGSEAAASDEAASSKKKKSKVKMEERSEEASGPSVPSGRAWLDFELGMGGYNRSLAFNQNINPALLSYTLGVGPIAVANVVMYPLDPLVGGLLGNLGLELEVQQGFAISSTLSSGGPTYKDVVHDYAGGGRYRFTFGAANDFYVSVTGGEDAFTFTGRSATNVLMIPDTIYHYVRPGLGLHLGLGGGLGLSLAGGYRAVLNNAGPQFQQFFSRATVAGADAELVVRYAVSPMFEARAGLEWRRYWFAMHSVPGDTYPAGGAVDQSFAFTARIAILIGSSNVPKAEGGSEEAPPPPPPNPKGRGHKSSEEESGGDEDSGAAPSVE